MSKEKQDSKGCDMLADRFAWFLPSASFSSYSNSIEESTTWGSLVGHLDCVGAAPPDLSGRCQQAQPNILPPGMYVMLRLCYVYGIALPTRVETVEKRKTSLPDKRHLREAKTGDSEQPHLAFVLKKLGQLRTRSMSKNPLLQAGGWK